MGLKKTSQLPRQFPFRSVFVQFLKEYASCSTYWYVPKARVLSDEYIRDMQRALTIVIDEFLESTWDRTTQDKLLKRLRSAGILDPYKPEGLLQDRTALVRIWKILAEWLGLLWVHDGKRIVITDSGLELITCSDPISVIENQIAKMQYPNPLLKPSYAAGFRGLVPHLFLLQVMRRCDYRITAGEYELFVNLASSHDDVDRIAKYIRFWRDLNDDSRNLVFDVLKHIPMAHPGADSQEVLPGFESESRIPRQRRVRQNASYQKQYYAFPRYLRLEEGEHQGDITCSQTVIVDRVVEERTKNLKVLDFADPAEWFSYFGDPQRKPSWYEFLLQEIEKAPSEAEAKKIVKKHKSKLSEDDRVAVERKQIEKRIEDFYSSALHMLEPGLTLVSKGRQFSTPIGRIDLLCQSKEREFVVVEIKVGEADDSSIGQILRYIGWVHRNLDGGQDNVRGIILAGYFGDKARYSRIGLLKKNYKVFLGFKKHNLDVTEA